MYRNYKVVANTAVGQRRYLKIIKLQLYGIYSLLILNGYV